MTEYIVKFHHDERGIVKTWDEVGELIRCKDCKHYEQWTNHKICMLLGSYYGDTKPNDYCSNAERRES